MTTLITVGNSEGTRRCDAVCHKAKPDTRCTCVCGGRYHASGSSEQARAQLTTDLLDGKLGDDLATAARAGLEQLTEAEARKAALAEHRCAGADCGGKALGRATYCASCAGERRNQQARDRRAEDHRYAGAVAAHRRERRGQLAIEGAAPLPELPPRLARRLEREATP